MPSPLASFSDETKRIVELAANIACRRFTTEKDFVEDGGLMSYGADDD